MTVTALVASMNPSIISRQNTGTDSEHLQQLQRSLLQCIYDKHAEAMYPAALCALADLIEARINMHKSPSIQVMSQSTHASKDDDESVIRPLMHGNEIRSYLAYLMAKSHIKL